MVAANELRIHSFWRLQAAGWFCFFLLSALVVFPYLWRPGELGYQSSKALFFDQGLMCLLCFLASLALRPVCRVLLQRSLSWIRLEVSSAAWSAVIGTSVALIAELFMIGKPEPIELVEGCAKTSVLLFLWCNLYFGLKHSQKPTLPLHYTHSPVLLVSQEGKPYNYATRFSVRTGSRVQIVSVNDVEWIAAAGDYSELHTSAGTHLLRQTMKSLEQRLDPARFVRIHRSRIVCLPLILELRSMENREYVVKLSDGSQHRCSRTYAPRIDSWLRNNQ